MLLIANNIIYVDFYPDLSAKEILPPRKNCSIPGPRRPIEELKATPQNKQYIKWRQSHGMTMSQPAYKKMRRELALKRQKMLEEGGTFMPGLPVRWVKKDGKLSYLGFEVNKHEDDTMSCALCPDYKSKSRLTMSRHIKKDHIGGQIELNQSFHVIVIILAYIYLFWFLGVPKTCACEQCDAKFMRPSELKNHIKRKHAGGYQLKSLEHLQWIDHINNNIEIYAGF